MKVYLLTFVTWLVTLCGSAQQHPSQKCYGSISRCLKDSVSFYQHHEVINGNPGAFLSLWDILPPQQEPQLEQTNHFFRNLCYGANHLFKPKHGEASYIGLLYTLPVLASNEELTDDYDLLRLNFDKIKADFNWGHPHSGANTQDKRELLKLVHVFSHQEAKAFANTPIVITYPYDLKGHTYNNIYSRCRCYVFYNGR